PHGPRRKASLAGLVGMNLGAAQAVPCGTCGFGPNPPRRMASPQIYVGGYRRRRGRTGWKPVFCDAAGNAVLRLNTYTSSLLFASHSSSRDLCTSNRTRIVVIR
ncbi:MAG TPA: hypothetical protein VJJ98_14070, partial [Sedimentisphaerales bacterium]|nr:hypothetical protein [Sedimentisphaerales bacterium]